MYYHIVALVTDLISVWLRYEVKYNMLLRLKESGQVSDSAVHGSLNKLHLYFVKCRVNTNNIHNKSSFHLYSKGGW